MSKGKATVSLQIIWIHSDYLETKEEKLQARGISAVFLIC